MAKRKNNIDDIDIVDDFELEAKDKEIGVVNWVGDGIANVDGIDHAFYGEIVVFDCGVKGMVQDVRRDEIGVILFGRDTDIKEGTRVIRTGKMAGIPVGEAFEGNLNQKDLYCLEIWQSGRWIH